MAAAGDVTVTIRANAKPALRSIRKVRRAAYATGLVIAHPLLVLALLVASVLTVGVLLGLLVA